MEAAEKIEDPLDLEEFSERRERGHWVLGFLGRLEDYMSLEAELLGIFRGLEIIQNDGMEAMEIDTNSATAIAMTT